MLDEPFSFLPFPGGLRCSPERLRSDVEVAQSKGAVTPQATAVIVHLQGEARGYEWLARMAEVEPARALLAALEAAKYTLTYRPEWKVCLLELRRSTVPFQVFAALRRGFDAHGGREGCEVETPESLPERAGLSWVFPERPLWSDDDRTASLLLPPTRHFLAAALRHRPELLGQPLTAAHGVDEEVLVLAGEPAAVARFTQRQAFLADVASFEQMLDHAPRALLEARTDGRHDAVERRLQRGPGKNADLDPWLVALSQSWRPVTATLPAAPWTTPFSKAKRAPLRAPSPPVFQAGGSWAASHRSNDPDPAVGPAFLAVALEDVGEAALPAARALTRARPALLADLEHIDDLGLAVSWVAALSRPAGGRGPDATSWVLAHAALSVPAAVLAFFEPEPDVHRGARLALTMLERTEPALVERTFSLLSPEQRAYVTASRAPPPFGKAPKLPAFVELATLPRVHHRDGLTELTDEARLELAMALKLSPAHDGESVMTLTSALDPGALKAFAGALALAWFRAGAPNKERWAVDALAHFGDDAWARALGSLAEQLIPERYTVAQVMIGTLAHLRSRHAVRALLRLTKSRTASIRKTAAAAMEQCSAALGLTSSELADQLVPDTAPDGFTLGKAAPRAADAATKAEWKEAAAAAKDAVARLERAMAQGTSMSTQAFLETWLLKPILRPLADHLIWGVYRHGARVGLRCGTSFIGVKVPEPDMRLRPVHRLELSDDELKQVSAWVKPKQQPFLQLERPVYGTAEVVQLQRLVGRPATRAKLKALELRGWPLLRIERLDGVERTGPGWMVRVQVDPPFFPGVGVDDEPSQVVQIDFTGAERVAPLLRSELQHDLHDVFG